MSSHAGQFAPDPGGAPVTTGTRCTRCELVDFGPGWIPWFRGYLRLNPWVSARAAVVMRAAGRPVEPRDDTPEII